MQGFPRSSAKSHLTTRHINSRWPITKTSHATDEQIISLPLHTKRVLAINITDRFDQMAHRLGTSNPSVILLGKAISLLHNSLSVQGNSLSDEAEISPEDLQRLIDDNLIVEIDGASCHGRCNTSVFTVPELNKERRRFITHTPRQNELCRLAQSINEIPHGMPTISSMREHFSHFRHGRTIDFKSYFHQFGLGIRNGLTFRSSGRWWELKTIPTGHSASPSIAQHYSACILEIVKGILPTHIKVKMDVYIDNVRWLCHSKEDLDFVTHVFYDVCRSLHVSINEDMVELLKSPTQEYDFLGMSFNHINGTTALSSGFQRKLADAHSQLRDRYDNLTGAELLSAFGKLQYAAQVNATPLGDFYYAFKLMRRRAAEQWSLDDPIRPWHSAKNTFLRWFSAEISAPPLHDIRDRPPISAKLYTDASGTGMGAVLLLDDGTSRIYARPWSLREQKLHINILEATAVYEALSHLDLPQSFDLLVDNTTVIYTVKKTRSRSFLLNKIIQRITLHQKFGSIASITYVESKNNWADGPSRWFEEINKRIAPKTF